MLRGKIDVDKKLAKTKFYTAIWNAQANAFYHYPSSSIFFNKRDANSTSIKSKRTQLHEIIHALNKVLSGKVLIMRGLAEGATENIVEKIFGINESSLTGKIEFNLSKFCAYKELVSIIGQMEIALNKSSVDETLGIEKGFFKEFSNKYGNDLFRFVLHRSNKLERSCFKSPEEHNQYFDDTQNTILERVFDRDFKSVTNLEDVEMYFEKLRKFELTRGKIKGNNYFEQYYDDKLNKAKELLMEQGLDISKIYEFLEKYKYQEQEFYPARDREEIAKIIQNESSLDCIKMCIPEIYKMGNENNQTFSSEESLKKIKGLWAENPQSPGGGYIFVLTYDNKPLSVNVYDKHKKGAGNIVYKQEKINQKNEDCPTVSNNDGKHFIKIPGSDESLQLEEIQFADNVNEKLIKELDLYVSKINNQHLNHGLTNNQNNNSKSILAKILNLGIERKVTTEEVQKAASDVLTKQHDKSIAIETDEK